MANVYLKDYVPSNYLIKQVYLEFYLDPSSTIVKSEIEFYRNKEIAHNANHSELVLHGEELELQSIAIDRITLDKDRYKIANNNLIIKNPGDKFTLYITNKINPSANTTLSGLYFVKDLFCTQCEAEGFRRITYYLDRPDVLAIFTTKIIAAKAHYPIILSNGNLVDKGDHDADHHYAVWHDPFFKPSYLFALVGGNLVVAEGSYLTKSKRLVALRIFVETKNLDQTSHALRALQESMLWDEEVYGLEYDLDTYMIVATDNFNMGAMENKGLNIFNSKYVLAKKETATDDDFVNIDVVIGHEYFHNYSGNRVTCRDWFQLSLKEGFTVFREQQFTQYITKSSVCRIKEVIYLRNSQFSEDASPLAHPVQPDLYQEINNFYTSTIYQKGAEVIRMLHTLLGQELYRKATDLYFNKFDGMAVTIEHFVACMTEVSGIDLTQFKLWYKQAGTPIVTVNKLLENDTFTLQCTQIIPDTLGQTNKLPMHIPIAYEVYDTDGKVIDKNILHLTKQEQKFTVKSAKNSLIALNAAFSAPIKLIIQDLAVEERLAIAKVSSDAFTVWDNFQEVYHSIIDDGVQLNTSINQEMVALLCGALQEVLHNDKHDNALKAIVLMLPFISESLQRNEKSCPIRILSLQQELHLSIAKYLFNDLNQIFENIYDKNKPYIYNAKECSDRMLLKVAIILLAKANPEEFLSKIMDIYLNSDNLTMKIACLQAVQNIDSEYRNKMFDSFYQYAASDALLINKWLSLEATSRVGNILQRVEELLSHEKFELKNPNNVYSLLGGFGSNVIGLHAKDYSGYDFIFRMVEKLDKINPQVAARVISSVMNFRTLPELNMQYIIDKLNKLKKVKNLSSDLSEVVIKCLAK